MDYPLKSDLADKSIGVLDVGQSTGILIGTPNYARKTFSSYTGNVFQAIPGGSIKDTLVTLLADCDILLTEWPIPWGKSADIRKTLDMKLQWETFLRDSLSSTPIYIVRPVQWKPPMVHVRQDLRNMPESYLNKMRLDSPHLIDAYLIGRWFIKWQKGSTDKLQKFA